MSFSAKTVDAHEVKKFDQLAASWWDKTGQSRPLHDMNPIRLQFIQRAVKLENQRVLDVGCGGGILSESLAHAGAQVTGIDASEKVITVAQAHAQQAQLSIHYQHITAQALHQTQPHAFDLLTCMELLEHVPDPASLIHTCAGLIKPGGLLFFSTLNRTPKAYLLAVIGAEYIMNILPKGTHDYTQFIRPSELDAWCQKAGLTLESITGMHYNPLTHRCKLTPDVSMNYLVCLRKPKI